LYRFYYFETEYTSNDLLLCVSQNSRPIGNMGGGEAYTKRRKIFIPLLMLTAHAKLPVF